MKVYEVGGAVRDRLLGKEPKDIDYVVVGATPEELIALGYKQVGADFPVFLHPETGAEYALARTERKTGVGYGGFEVTYDPTVTLEDDLRRRDLTINAMARDLETGEIIDPYGGQIDLANRTLRHVSEAFAEDPLRVLRVARFAARYNFSIEPSTLALMQDLVASGELAHLTTERVWIEIEKALMEEHCNLFASVLKYVGAWDVFCPEFKIDWNTYSEMYEAALLNLPFEDRFAALFGFMLPDNAEVVLERFGAPNNVKTYVRRYLMIRHAINIPDDKCERVARMFRDAGLYKDPEMFYRIVKHHMFLGFNRSKCIRLIAAAKAAAKITFASIRPDRQKVLKGKEIGEEIDRIRLEVIKSKWSK